VNYAQETKSIKKDTIIIENEENANKTIELAQYIEAAIINNTPDDFASKMAFPLFLKSITNVDNENNTEAYQKGFKDGFKDSFNTSFPQKLSNSVANGAFYDFISYKYDIIERTYYMLFRFYSEEEGVNYHDYKVSVVNGEYKFSDIYIYLTGEHLSSTLKRMYILTFPKDKNENFITSNSIKEMQTYFKAIELSNSQDYINALKEINKITSSLKDEKFFQIMKINIASKVSEDFYFEALEELIQTHKEDPTIYLNQIDYYLLKQKYNKAMEMVELLEYTTEDDFLNFLKGNIYFLKEDTKQAYQHFLYITENYPDYSTPYLSAIYCLVLEKEYDQCIPLLTRLSENYEDKKDIIDFFESEDENGDNEYKDLVDSKAFKKWKMI
jgi:predicted negative regulator of RcsB-dependent stress response